MNKNAMSLLISKRKKKIKGENHQEIKNSEILDTRTTNGIKFFDFGDFFLDAKGGKRRII